MNIKNLKEGMVIKNYKELCKILGIKVTTGYSKQKQLKNLSFYCDYKKSGNKFIIKSVYDKPTIPISDMKKGKYIQQLSNIIIEYLYNSEELKEIQLFKLLNVLGITNANYENVNKYKNEFRHLKNIQLASIYYFYSNTKLEFKRIVESCLNNLQKRRILNWRRCVMIVDNDTKEVYKADVETEKMIITTEYMALQELNKPNMYELMKDLDALDEFNRLVKLETGGLNYYYSYEVVIGDMALKCEYKNIQDEKRKLNSMMVAKLDDKFNKDKFAKYKNDYDILIDSLINIDNDISILDELKSKRIDIKTNCRRNTNKTNNDIDTYKNKEGLSIDNIRF